MEVVAGAVLSVSLEFLFEKLASSDVLSFARQQHIQTQLKKWEKKLQEIGEVLNDAEEKQISKKSVKAWLSDLRDLAYDMEDVLDEFSYEALPRKLIAEGSTGRKVCKFIPTCCTSAQAMHNVKIGSQIEDINTRLEAIYSQKAELGLDKVAAITQSTWERPLSTSLVHEPWVYGRDVAKQIIKDMLLKDEESIETSVSIISIVAMGGMGKTTLARLVYDDAQTTKHFNLKAWACVSDQFDAMRVTQTILNSVTSGSSTDLQDFNQIQDKLREELMGNKFLLVLDDIWNENYGDWDCLRSPFLSGAPGSKIIITTRNKNVAMMMTEDDKNIYELTPLSDDDCWLVFQKHAFGSKNMNEHPNLVSIGRGIVNKCGGLPLAAKALGGLLRNEQREDKWNIILSSHMWDLPSDKCDVLPALRLSYNHLPSPLKRCFSYCAIFPKDYEFDKEELFRLWMAEGFIQQSGTNKQITGMDDLCNYYFQELMSRSFFQPSSNNESHFIMHNLVNDLAKFVVGEICFSLEENFERNHQQLVSKKSRHLSFIRSRYVVSKNFEVFHSMERLRTFVALPIDTSPKMYWLSNKVLEELLLKLKYLRVLSLTGYRISEIPSSIGDLKHLKYLNLSGTGVKGLPQSIGHLYKLETLILSKCSHLRRLPLNIENLYNLRYLDVSYTSLEEMPPQISKLKCLHVLSTFIVGEANGLNVKELRNMVHLRGRLHISKLENVINIQDVRDASLKQKDKLENLMLSWNLSDPHKIGNQADILDSLQPHFGLNKLVIEGFGGPKFSHWLEDGSFSKMVKMELLNCKNCTLLPCLGELPMLKHLVIGGMAGIKNVGKEFHGKSPSFLLLESLSFYDMSEWEDWEIPSESESYPCLLQLTIEDCPKLIKELSTYLPSLVHLSISGCPRLESTLARLPSLSKLRIGECNEAVVRSGVDLHSLEEFQIFNMVGLTRLLEGFMQLLTGLQVLGIHRCDELRCLWEDGFDGIPQFQTSNCPKVVSLGEDEQNGLLSKLRSLDIWKCGNLEKLPNGLHKLTCLTELRIEDCPKLSSFPNSSFLPMLTRLVIGDCKGLACLPDWIMVAREGSNNNVCILEYLSVRGCPSLVSFPEGQLPRTLETLIISSCENLESLPEGELSTALKELRIRRCEKLVTLPGGLMYDSTPTSSAGSLHTLEIVKCPSLEFFPAGKFPSTLKRVWLDGCIQPDSISEMFHSGNSSLEILAISGFPSLKTIPNFLSNLLELRIRNCKNVKLLPYQLQRSTALTSLHIRNCKSVRMPLSQWGLATLTSLKQLTIGGIFPKITSFSDAPAVPPLLPTALTALYIENFKNLKSLSSLALQTLTCLEVLSIDNCPKLESFCPREGLPPMLSQLSISGCPLLKARCAKEKSQDWPRIARIPCVEIDYIFPFEL